MADASTGPGTVLAAVVVGQWVLNNLLKVAVGRERPNVGRVVGVARVYRGIHHASDVVAGGVLGGLSVFAARRLVGGAPPFDAPIGGNESPSTVDESSDASASAAVTTSTSASASVGAAVS